MFMEEKRDDNAFEISNPPHTGICAGLDRAPTASAHRLRVWFWPDSDVEHRSTSPHLIPEFSRFALAQELAMHEHRDVDLVDSGASPR